MQVPEYNDLDLARNAEEIVLDLIYMSNKVKLYPDRTELGTPMALDTKPSVSYDENTHIQVTIDNTAAHAGYAKEWFEYHRLSFDEAMVRAIPAGLAGCNVHDVLDQINAAYRLQLTTDDVANTTITEGTTFLKAAPTAMVWQGKHKVPVRNHFLSRTDLDGFRKYKAA